LFALERMVYFSSFPSLIYVRDMMSMRILGAKREYELQLWLYARKGTKHNENEKRNYKIRFGGMGALHQYNL
jgi:retron-type reverse transcriptase